MLDRPSYSRPVKEGAQSSPGEEIVHHVDLYLDYFPGVGDLWWSMIDWHWDGVPLLEAMQGGHYDVAHIGMAPLDLTAGLFRVIRVIPNPFP